MQMPRDATSACHILDKRLLSACPSTTSALPAQPPGGQTRLQRPSGVSKEIAKPSDQAGS